MTATTEFVHVLATIRTVADRGEEFTTDDVWFELDFIPSERNVVGKAFSEANRIGIIEGTERFVQSRRTEAKGRRVQVWRVATSVGHLL